MYNSMGMRTVYIRKENEEVFDSLENKSKTINSILDQIKKKRLNEPTYVEPEPYA